MPEMSSTCPYCGVGCGLSVAVDAKSSATTILASQTHPANFGRLCSKGSALGETLVCGTSSNAPQATRLTNPEIDGQAVDWDQASSAIAQAISDSIEAYGQDSVAFYLSGQLLTEDYYVANKLMKGFIGTANVDTNSRLCMSSAVAGYKRAFGSDSVPCSYEDLELADLIVLIGSNAAWTHPVLYQRMVEAKKNNPAMRVVLIDPRMTASAELADLHLQLAPSSDGFLLQGLFNYLIENEALDSNYIAQHTDGFEQAAHAVATMSIEATAARTGVDQVDLATFFNWFASTRKTVSFYSQGINQSATGADKCNAIINCHLATGKIGYAGAGPFSITGQPNAMGGREVGGLANQLAAHMDFEPEDVDRVQRFWQSPTIATQPGLKAVDLFDAVDAGQIKVLWIIATNPAVSLPDSNKVRAALAKCPTVIVSDVCHTDTTVYADIILPALGWSEKDGTVTNSERRISRQQKFRSGPGAAAADWWALTQVARKLGFEKEFNYSSPHDVFIEHAQLSGFENAGTRGFDIGGLADLSADEYQSLAPIQWPVNAANPNGNERMFEDGCFFTKTQRAQFVSNSATLADCMARSDYPLVLNTGRVRDQWHTMTRTGLAPTLNGHDDIPFVQIHPRDATQYGLAHNEFARLRNPFGAFICRVEVSEDITPGQLFSPIHWSDQFAKNAVVSNLVSPEVDPVSGQPESKASAVAIEPYQCRQWARIISQLPIDCEQFDYWARSNNKTNFVTLVGTDRHVDWREWVASYIGAEAEIVFFSDDRQYAERLLVAVEGEVKLLIYTHATAAKLPSRAWLDHAFANTSAAELSKLIVGEQGGQDKLICGCFQTTEKAIKIAIDNGHASLDSLAANLGCGSKCGSCRPEVAQLLGAEGRC